MDYRHYITNIFKTLNSNFSLKYRLLMRKYNRQKLSIQIIIVFSIFTIILFLFFTFFNFFYDVQNSSIFLQTHTCPACLGFKACDKFKNKEIKLTLASTVKAFVSSSNYIFKGHDIHGQKLVISRITNASHVEQWENKICTKVILFIVKKNYTFQNFHFLI